MVLHAAMISEIYYDAGHATVMEAGGRLTLLTACVCVTLRIPMQVTETGNTPCSYPKNTQDCCKQLN